MLHSHLHHNHQFLFTNLPISLTTHHFSSPSPLHKFHHNSHSIYAINPSQEVFLPWLNKLTTAKVELSPIFDAIDDSSSNQVTFSVVLSVAIAVFFFPTIQRRIKRAKQLLLLYSSFPLSSAESKEQNNWSSGVKKSSLNSSKGLMGSTSKKSKNPPSPDKALLGAVMAGVIAVILYRFTTTIEASLYRQTISDNFSVRQITITIRTVINGLCYLATFVYGINSFGLLLYSGQLALNSFVEGPSSGKKTESKIMENHTNSNKNEDQSSNNSQ